MIRDKVCGTKPARNNAGFTLIELAIVLIVIGLIVVGIMGSRTIIHNARLRSIMTEYDQYKVGFKNFRLKYRGLPGDIRNAGSYWPSCDSPATNCNGDGDGFIEPDGEDMRAWQQLADAGFIAGDFTGVYSGGNIVVGTNVPPGDIAPGGFWLRDSDGTAVNNRIGHYIRYGAANGSDLDAGVLLPIDSFTIDKKMDNGEAATGEIMGQNGNGVSTCLSSGEYDYDGTATSCTLVYWME